jgi:hypothetical protein
MKTRPSGIPAPESALTSLLGRILLSGPASTPRQAGLRKHVYSNRPRQGITTLVPAQLRWPVFKGFQLITGVAGAIGPGSRLRRALT